MAAGLAHNLEKGIEMAKTAIDSGAAMDKLKALAEFTTENG
jgi:anthranilate phosphoribosyltransferase